MSTEPTLPLPGAGAPGPFPPPTDPWSTPLPPQREAFATDPEPLSPRPVSPPSSGSPAFAWGDATPTPPPGPAAPASGPPISGPPISGSPIPGSPIPTSGSPISGPPVPASGPPIPTPRPPISGPAPGSPYPVSPPYPVGPPVAVPSPAAGPVLVQIGEIAVTSASVRTPAGEIPLRGSTWHVADYWQSEQRTPRWAVVAAIVGFCVLTVLSLLFLLVKETVHRGMVQVTVGNGRWQYVARIPVTNQYEVQQINERVNYVRSLAAG